MDDGVIAQYYLVGDDFFHGGIIAEIDGTFRGIGDDDSGVIADIDRIGSAAAIGKG